TGKTTGDRSAATKPELMDLDAAREFFGGISRGLLHRKKDTSKRSKGITALDQVKRYPRNIIIGAPGSGKSTFLEWLQLRLASVEEELVLAGQQAVPMLLRVRQLDAQNLPRGRSLIEYATASKDRATLMPPEWVDRQMKQGRFLFMLDGLDETEPELRDRYVIPWLQELCMQYPRCHYLISSRPVGYPAGGLNDLKFAECELQDFDESEIGEYCCHWCTAVRLARNEPEAEA